MKKGQNGVNTNMPTNKEIKKKIRQEVIPTTCNECHKTDDIYEDKLMEEARADELNNLYKNVEGGAIPIQLARVLKKQNE